MPVGVPVPANGVAGVDVSAAFWNAQVRDAITFLANPPHCVMYQTVSQAITGNTAILFDTNEIDSYGGHSTVTNTAQYVAQVVGWYQCSGVVAFNASGTAGSTRQAIWFKNGVAVPAAAATTWAQAVTSVNTSPASVTREIFLNVGDFVSLLGSATDAAHTQAASVSVACMATIRWVHS
jgi:hypothetical protein